MGGTSQGLLDYIEVALPQLGNAYTSRSKKIVLAPTGTSVRCGDLWGL